MGCLTAPSGTVGKAGKDGVRGASKAMGWSRLVTLGVGAHFLPRKLLRLGNSL